MQANRQKVTVGGIMRKYGLTCSPDTVRTHIFKAMRLKWLHRSRKPGVPRTLTHGKYTTKCRKHC